MDIVGFAHINKNATTCKGAKNPNEFIGKICPVYEFGRDESVLVLNPLGRALAMFDKIDIYRSFKCGYSNGVVTPPDLKMLFQTMYVTKALSRKGGYNKLLRSMVIEASLAKGVFTDGFLWAKQ